MTKRLVVLAVAASVALAAQPSLARGTRGGGRPGGAPGGHPGGRPGGGYAVPRGSAPAYRPAGVPQARHPQAGRGYSYGSPGHYPGYGGRPPSYGHGRYPSYGYGGRSPAYGYGRYPYYGYGGRYPAYGYGRYPYYGYGHRYYPPYYGSSFGLYFGFGSAYGYAGLGLGWPYGYGAYGWGVPYYPPAPVTHVYVSPSDRSSEDSDAEAPRSDDVRRDTSVPNTGHVRLDVRPDDASVYVDDEFWGKASETRRMALRAGRHTIELVRPGFDVTRREVELAPGDTSDVTVDMPRR